MQTPILILCLSLALGGCSILRKDETPVCDGKHRRPANTAPSVLDTPTGALKPPGDQLSAGPLFFASCA